MTEKQLSGEVYYPSEEKTFSYFRTKFSNKRKNCLI